MKPKDSWEKYLQRVDQLIAWCLENNIPIKTQCEWAETLYGPKQEKLPLDRNIFPSLKNDLDGNNCPDGYILRKGKWDKEKHEIVCDNPGNIFTVNKLAGLAKGKNKLSFCAKSDGDCKLRVVADFPGIKKSRQQKTFSIKAGESNNCSWDLAIPKEASTGNFTWFMDGKDKCGISKISLKKEAKK
jgi:hypothetical protein